MIFRRALAFLVLAVACGPLPLPTPAPAPSVDGEPELCPAACARMRELGCPEAEPTPDGASCETWCDNVERSGSVSLNPGCLAEIKECREIDACSR